MPTKTTYLESFYVHSPDYPMDKTFENFLNMHRQMGWTEEFLKALPIETIRMWEQFYTEYKKKPEIWRKRFQSCNVFFNTPAELKGPFSIIKISYEIFESLGNIANIKILFNEKDANSLQSALLFRAPLRWPTKVLNGKTPCFPYLFGNHLWILSKEDETANEDELRLLFLEAVDKERKKFERLKSKFDGIAGAETPSNREPIPGKIRTFVWRRDNGKCVCCGMSEQLEFDHIIPLSKGGSSTERNLQLLCQVCNREKKDHI